MSRKRPASPQTLPQAKRQAIESWVKNQVPHPTIKPTVECDRPSSPSPAPPSTSKSSSTPPGRASSEIRVLWDNTSYALPEEMTSTPVSEAPTAESNISIGPDMPRFQDQLRFRGVRDADQDDETVFPGDWEELEKIKRKSRESPESSPEEHKEFRRTVRDMTNEAGLMALLVPKILKATWGNEPNTSWEHDKTWSQHIPLPRDGCARLTDPKPDQAIGWKPNSFAGTVDGRVDAALTVSLGGRKFGSYASPCEGMYWPVVTVEGKGAAGQARIARLQNLHNASIMLNNQHELCIKAQRAEYPYQRVMAITIIVTAESAEVNCHWIAKAADGSLTFWGRLLEAWGLSGREKELYINMRRTIRNCVEWVRARTLVYIQQDLDALRQRLQLTVPQQTPSGKSTQRGKSSGQSRAHVPTLATNRLSVTGSIDTERPPSASQSSVNSLASNRSKDSEGTTAATSSTSHRRKQTPSMLADPESKLRRGHPPSA